MQNYFMQSNYESSDPNMKYNSQKGIPPQINNRYIDSDTIYIDPSIKDMHKNGHIQFESNHQINPILKQKMPLQTSSNSQRPQNQKTNTTFQRNYIIYQPMTAFQQPEVSSERDFNLSSFPDEENNDDPSQNIHEESFINDTEQRDNKKFRLQQFVKGSYIWKEDSTALLNILNEKMEELKTYYSKQEERAQHFFYTLEKLVMSEKNNMIFALQESLRMNLNQVDLMMKQLQIYQEECDKLQEDVAHNFTDIIEEMRNEPFNDILKMYNSKLSDFDQFTKRSCQSVNVELVSMEYVGSSTTTNLSNKWETTFKNNFMNKVIQLNSQYSNIMKDNLTKPLLKNSSRDKVFFMSTQQHTSNIQNSINLNGSNYNHSHLNLSNPNHHQSSSSLSINSKRSNRSTSLMQAANNQNNNCNKSSLSNVQALLANNTLDLIAATHNNSNTISQRANELHERNPSQNLRSQRVNSNLNSSDYLTNNSFAHMNNSSVNSMKNSTLAQKIRTQTMKNSQVTSQPQKKKTNSIYTNILKNAHKNMNLQIDLNKQVNSQNRIMFTTTNASTKYIDFERNNIENINTINFNLK